MVKLKHVFLLFSIFIFLSACDKLINNNVPQTNTYKPDNKELYDSIVHMDKLLFDSYNKCDSRLEEHAALFSEDVEFYHDKGGACYSKQELIDRTKKYICGKITRVLVEGSIEVYPIKDYGAVEIGLHKFHNKMDHPETTSDPGKFITLWKKEKSGWKVTRVISLH